MLDFNEHKSYSLSQSPGQAFIDEMLKHDLSPGAIIADGKLHRFDVDRRGNQAGWYVFHGDNIPAGTFGNWQTGLKKVWSSKSETDMSETEIALFRRQMADAVKARNAEKHKAEAEAAAVAIERWKKAKPATADNKYLTSKGVQAYEGVRGDEAGNIILPGFRADGTISTLQTITPRGKKRFLPNGRIKECFFEIPGGQEVYIVEGYATAATIHEVTSATVIVAFNAGNLKPVAEIIRRKYGGKITIAADNDQFTALHDGRPNPGLIYANEAAAAIGANVVYPTFKDLSEKPTDFNDLAQLEGVAAVKKVLSRDQFRFAVTDWGVDKFSGTPPERAWLVENTFPMSTVSVLAAAGDAGKGMLSLDLAIKIAGGPDPNNLLDTHEAFGNAISQHGAAVILTAEDDKDEMHRRLVALGRHRIQTCKDGLYIIPLPNAGGPVSLITPGSRGPETSPAYFEIRDQLKRIADLKLIVFDPLASFCAADINSDPAVGAYAFGLLSSLGTETGAAVIVAHHMSKPPATREIVSADQARNLIRGSTAIIDGVRAAYALWRAPKYAAKKACEIAKQEYSPNKVFYGALVKANGPGDREIKTFIRNPDTGLLEVWDNIIKQVKPDTNTLATLLCLDISNAADAGRPFTKTGASGVYERSEELDKRLQGVGDKRIRALIDDLLKMGELKSCIGPGSKKPQWLDIPGGPFDLGIGEIVLGGKRDTD